MLPNQGVGSSMTVCGARKRVYILYIDALMWKQLIILNSFWDVESLGKEKLKAHLNRTFERIDGRIEIRVPQI